MIHPNDMRSWQIRVSLEKESLYNKMSKLAMFILSNKVINVDVELLRDQYMAMEKYHDILVRRMHEFVVLDFPEKEKSHE